MPSPVHNFFYSSPSTAINPISRTDHSHTQSHDLIFETHVPNPHLPPISSKNPTKMGKKKVNILPSLFSKNREETEQQQPWLWASACKNPKTLSFRGGDHGSMFKTVNSVFFDEGFELDTPETPHFTNTSESTSLSTTESEFEGAEESLELVVRGARSDRDRLFFEPHGDSSSIVGPAAAPLFSPFEESVVLAMESEDPYRDFRRSMEEMVESCGIKDWDCLEELLGWYLRVNGKNNHGFIVEAFIDLLLSLNNGGDCGKNDTSFSSAASSFSDESSDPSLKGVDSGVVA